VNKFSMPVFFLEGGDFRTGLFDPAQNPTLSAMVRSFQYETINDVDNDNNYATVGMEDYQHRRGCNMLTQGIIAGGGVLAAGRAIKITTDPPGMTTNSSLGEARPAQH